jgi:hypothetical protein
MENLFKVMYKERKGVRRRAVSGLGTWLTELFTPRVLVSRVLVFSASAEALIMVLQTAATIKFVPADRCRLLHAASRVPAGEHRRPEQVFRQPQCIDRGRTAAGRQVPGAHRSECRCGSSPISRLEKSCSRRCTTAPADIVALVDARTADGRVGAKAKHEPVDRRTS